MSTRSMRTAAGLALSAVTILACADQPTTPDRGDGAPALVVTPITGPLSSPQWQQRARALVTANSQSPIAAGRTYAAVSIAQYRAVLAVDEQLTDEGTQPGQGLGIGGRSRYEARRGAVAGASVRVLSFLYPSAAEALELQVVTESLAGAGAVHPSFLEGEATGRAVGSEMVAHLMTDGIALPWTGTVPVGPGFWIANGSPAGANLAGVKPYYLSSTSQFRPAAPPAFGSADFNTDLNEVLAISQTRTAQQIALAHFWNLPAPSATPLGFWNQLASSWVQEANLDERRATHVLALTHGSQFDAQLGCFEAKYTYFTIRPAQADNTISLVFNAPNHPSYPSGHSCISSSAARVLEYFFPDRAAELEALVSEAGLSRVYAGIHYRFDVTAGQELGTAVADWAIAKDQNTP